MPIPIALSLQGDRSPAPSATAVEERTRDIDTVGDVPPVPVWLGPCIAATALVAAVGLSGVRGADYPAHEFRAEFWRRAAGASWNFAWYGGHAVAPYGVLSPPLVAVLGPFVTVAAATVVATLAFTAIVHHAAGRPTATVAGYAFAATAIVNVVVGRVAFAVGLAIGLLAILAWQRGKLRLVLAGALATALASPVAAVFLALCALSVAIAALRPGNDSVQRRFRVRLGLAIAAVAAIPVAATSLAFGNEGDFPFRGGHLAITVGVTALVAATVKQPVVRITCVLSSLAAIALFVVPNAMGGNFVRFPQIIGVPLLVAAVATRRPAPRIRRTAMWSGVAVAVAWSASPAVVAAATRRGDPSLDRDFYAPLVAEVQRRNRDGAPGRLEIPFTTNHWEAAWVAPEVPYARGWERQVDRFRNPELYDAGLDADAYRAWLGRNAVRWIALPEAPLDHSGRPAADIVLAAERRGEPWIRRVWQHEDWVLYEVERYRPIVGEGAELVRLDVHELVVAADGPAIVRIGVVHSRTLAIWPAGCLARAADGTLLASLPRGGTYRITSALWDAQRSQDCSLSS